MFSLTPEMQANVVVFKETHFTTKSTQVPFMYVSGIRTDKFYMIHMMNYPQGFRGKPKWYFFQSLPHALGQIKVNSLLNEVDKLLNEHNKK